MVVSIEGEALHAHRARLVSQALYGFWTALPVFVATLAMWRPELWLLATISGVVVFAGGFGSVRGARELRLPLAERFELEDEVLTRYVGGEAVARIPRGSIKTAFADRRNLMIAGGRKQIIIPRASEGFDELEAQVRLWVPIQTRREMFEGLGRRNLARVVVFGALMCVALGYMVWLTGLWVPAAAGVLGGVVVAEGSRRVLLGWSLARVEGLAGD